MKSLRIASCAITEALLLNMYQSHERTGRAMEIDWVEPPKRTSGRFKNANDEAMSFGRRKGVWGKLDTYESYRSAHHRAHRIRAGKILGYAMVGTFESKVCRIPEGYGLWVRCVDFTPEYVAFVSQPRTRGR